MINFGIDALVRKRSRFRLLLFLLFLRELRHGLILYSNLGTNWFYVQTNFYLQTLYIKMYILIYKFDASIK